MSASIDVVAQLPTSLAANDSPQKPADPALEAELDAYLKRYLSGIIMLGAGSQVIMELALLPVGRGVAESVVESGRGGDHVVKRLRTTLGFMSIAIFGSDHERRLMKQEVGRAHRYVNDKQTQSDVKYNAFSPELQLWVAACLNYDAIRTADIYLNEKLSPQLREAIYQRCQSYGTALQVKPEMWPANYEAFELYWQANLKEIEFDQITREHLLAIIDGSGAGVPPIVSKTIGRVNAFITWGLLPKEFRDALGISWSPRQQKLHRLLIRSLALPHSKLPSVIRRFPFNFFHFDTRRRLKRQNSFVGEIRLDGGLRARLDQK